jgi:uncharacterized protein involved in exopolysaccharide biosynthesis
MPTTKKSTVTVIGLITLFWKERIALASFAAAAIVIAVIYSITRTPLYDSESLLAPAPQENLPGGGLAGLVGSFSAIGDILGLMGGGMDIEETVAVLNSREFTDRFIETHGVLPYLFSDQWDADKKAWKAGAGTDTGWTASMRRKLDDWAAGGAPAKSPAAARPGPSPEEAYKRFDKLRKVVIDRRTKFVRLTLRARTPQLAQSWSEAMIKDLNSALQAKAQQDAARAVDVLGRRVASEQIESIRVTAAKLLESHLQRQVLAEVRQDYAVKVLDPPTLPERRSYPRRTRMVIIGCALGMFLGAVFVLGRKQWREMRRARAA